MVVRSCGNFSDSSGVKSPELWAVLTGQLKAREVPDAAFLNSTAATFWTSDMPGLMLGNWVYNSVLYMGSTSRSLQNMEDTKLVTIECFHRGSKARDFRATAVSRVSMALAPYPW